MTRILFLSLFIISTIFSVAQVSNDYHNFSINEGLPSSQIYSMTEDSYGYLWFFTDHGISRYDGYQFENFNKSNGLTDDVIFNYFRTDTEIWVIGQDKSINIISGINPTFTPYEFNDTIKKYGRFNPKALFIDKRNQDLIINFEYATGVLMIDKNGNVIEKPVFQNERKDTSKVSISILKKEFSVENIGSKTKLSSKQYNLSKYFTKTKGISINAENAIFIKGDSTIEVQNKSKSHYIPHHNNALNVGIIDSTTYWLSFIGKGIKYITTNGKETAHLFRNKTITQLYIDKEHNKWFSTLYNGVFMLPSNQFNKIETTTDYNNISAIESSNNNLFIGLKNGNVFKLENNRYKIIHKASKAMPIVFTQKNNTILFIADRTLFEYKRNKNILIHNISVPYRINFTENGELGYSGTFGYKSFKDKKAGPNINVRRTYDFITYKNQLYLGSYHGLFKHISEHNNMAIIDSRINRLAIINDLLFIGTHGDGLYIYNGSEFTLKITGNQLNGGYITSIQQQNKNTIWIGTNTGLSKLVFTDETDRSRYIITDYSNSIPEKEITDLELVHDTLWVATNNGLYFSKLSSQKVIAPNRVNYNLNIEYVEVNDKVTNTERLKHLSYNENRLTIHYKAIRFKQNHNILYRHRLAELENDWNYSEKQSATYASIPPGEYEFIVQVKEEHENWKDQQKSLFITINKPYWKTEAFIIGSISFIVVLIYLFFKYRIFLYNKDIVRELLRHLLKKIQRNEKSIIIKVSGTEVKIVTDDILYVKSDGNYLEIHTHAQKHLTREKISNFLNIVPDPIEFLQIRRSYIVRLDKITEKGKKHIMINDVKIQVGETYLEKFKLINFSTKK